MSRDEIRLNKSKGAAADVSQDVIAMQIQCSLQSTGLV